MARLSKQNLKLEKLQAEKTHLMVEIVLNMNGKYTDKEVQKARQRIKDIRLKIRDNDYDDVKITKADLKKDEPVIEEETDEEVVEKKKEYKTDIKLKAEGPKKVLISKGPIVF